MTESNTTPTLTDIIELAARQEAINAELVATRDADPLNTSAERRALIAANVAARNELMAAGNAYAAAEGITLAEVYARCMAAKG
jgi:hypothetical protein